jgi:hypothetical protein
MALRDNLRNKWFKNNQDGYSRRDLRDRTKWQPTNMNNCNGKGSGPRNKNVSSEEEDLRWKLAFGKISEQEFNEAMEKLNGEENN